MVVETVPVAPDSQFRLVPCECGGNPNYWHFTGESIPVSHWMVSCPDCKRKTKKAYQARHDAQLEWNEEMGVK